MANPTFTRAAYPAFSIFSAAPYRLLVVYVRPLRRTRLHRRTRSPRARVTRRFLAYYDPFAASLMLHTFRPGARDVQPVWDAGAGRMRWLPLDRVERIVTNVRPARVATLPAAPDRQAVSRSTSSFTLA